MRIFIFKIVVVLLSLSTFVFNNTISSQTKITYRKESSIVKKGNKAYQEMRYLLATRYYLQYVKHEAPRNLSVDVLTRLADCQWMSRQLGDCLETYEKLIPLKKNNQFGEKEKIRISELYVRVGKYEEAGKWLTGIAGYEKKANAYIDAQSKYEMLRDSDCWEIWPLKSIPGYRVFSPVLVDSVLIFSGVKIGDVKNTSKRQNVAYKIDMNNQQPNTKSSVKDESSGRVFYKNKVKRRRLANVYEGSDVAVAQRSKYVYLNKQYAIAKDTVDTASVNSMDGARSQFMSMAIDINKKVYITSPNDDNEGAHLEQGDYDGQGIKKTHRIQFRNWNTKATIIHPAISPKGDLLVFSSNKGVDFADYDLYYSHQDSITQEWSNPKPLTALNTVGNEIFPGITADGYLYFSSDNMPGLGGFDIYRIKLDDALKNKGKIEHLSYPVNSSADDYSWTQYPDNLSGYFTTDRNLAVDNIYGFRYTPKIEITGTVKNNLTGTPVKQATVFACSPLTGKIAVVKTDSLGHYTLRVKKGSDLVIRSVINPYDTVFANNVVNEFSRNVVVHGDGNENNHEIKELSLNQLSKGMKWALDTIFYDFNKWDIKTESYNSLNKVVKLLKEYPLVHIEIASYTDKRGSDVYNLWLSQQRANSVVQYLINAGIRSDRVQGKGYGKAIVSALNDGIIDDEQQYRVSRRTEIRIAGYDTQASTVKPSTPDWTKFSEKDVLDVTAFPQGFFMENSSEDKKEQTNNQAATVTIIQSPSKEVLKDSLKNGLRNSPKEKIVLPAKKSKTNTLHPVIVKIESSYCVQVGVFFTPANATRLVYRLEGFLLKKHQCFVLESGESLFKVCVGHFNTYKEAQLVAKEIEATFVW